MSGLEADEWLATVPIYGTNIAPIIDLEKFWLRIWDSGHIALYPKFRTRGEPRRLPNKYNGIASMEELKIRLDMEGRHVQSKH